MDRKRESERVGYLELENLPPTGEVARMRPPVRIIVADGSEVTFYDATGPRAPLAVASSAENPAARLPDRDLDSDRPGRAFSSVSQQRSAMDGERSSRRSSQEDFARWIAQEIDEGRNSQSYDWVVLIAGPRMLGLIRDALSVPARQLIVAEIPKDLVHSDERTIRLHVPRSAFRKARATGARVREALRKVSVR